MLANYHTHTVRCHHAKGTEREYIEHAVEQGLRILGFSDHAPYCFPNGYTSNFRMGLEDFDGYCQTLSDLKAEYRGQIELHIGLEMEYYPSIFAKTLDWMRGSPIEYLILGQHFLGDEADEPYSGSPNNDEATILRYLDQTTEALKTGCYTYFAHPDLIRGNVSPEFYRSAMTRLCETAKQLHIPMELNLLGVGEHRAYPNDVFWSIVHEVGCDVVIGCDAHAPENVPAPPVLQEARAYLERFGLTPMQTVELQNPFAPRKFA